MEARGGGGHRWDIAADAGMQSGVQRRASELAGWRVWATDILKVDGDSRRANIVGG